MAVLVSNETYTRFVFDPEEGETKFAVEVGGEEKIVAVEDLEETLAADDAKLTRMLVVPLEDATKINITFKPLRSYDKHVVQDITSDQGTGSPGSQRRMLIKRAVVRWDYETPWSEAILDQLDAGIEEQIWGWISWGVEPLEQDPVSGQPIPLDDTETKKNRAQRRSETKTSSSPKATTVKDEPVSPAPNEDDSTS